MEYVALYRKYRPQTFEQIIGQEHITKTLANQVKSGKVSHAYLFTGTRGTGKTSAARILAKAVNCQVANDGDPCNKCQSCVSANGGLNVDIIEIDAASNNGVDFARDIRDKVIYPPNACKYKVYIIDEVHMLTGQAFNALLKTLEEPPEYVIFILCTTEVQKLPLTILSRCMRFDFHLVATEMLVNLLKEVYTDNKKQYTQTALQLIATCAEGSVRDCLSLADRCLHYTEGQLTYDDVMNVIGATNKQTLLDIAESIINCDIGKALTVVNSAINEGKGVALLAKDLAMLFKDLVVAKTTDKANEILQMPQDLFDKVVSLAKVGQVDRMLQGVVELTQLDDKLRYSSNARLLLETTIIKLSSVVESAGQRLRQ